MPTRGTPVPAEAEAGVSVITFRPPARAAGLDITA
jgi:hypothetical protein